jgi:hypothetical protein
MKCCICLLFALLVESGFVTGQIGYAYFSKAGYGAGAQNWAFQQDATGNLYVANNEGLLTFNGARWQLFPLPNRSILRSISFNRGNTRLYAGAQDEMGYFETAANGTLQYFSLVDQLPAGNRQFSDVWHIAVQQDAIFFQTYSALFRWNGQRFTIYQGVGKWNFVCNTNNRLLAQHSLAGLLEFSNGRWDTLAKPASMPANISFTAAASCAGAILLTTAQHGLWLLRHRSLVPFNAALSGAAASEQFTSAAAMANGHWALGTYENGVMIIDSLGRLTQQLGINEGLHNNNVKAIFAHQQQLWIGLDDGIAHIDPFHPITWFRPPAFNGAPGYAMARAGNETYFATANGLYNVAGTDWLTNAAKQQGVNKIAGGLTWNVQLVGGRLLVSRDDGLFAYQQGMIQAIDQQNGYWVVKQWPGGSGKPIWLGGHYQGLTFLGNENALSTKQDHVKGFDASARFVEPDSNLKKIWITHPYRGVYQIDAASRQVKTFGQANGLPSALNNHVFEVNNEILFATIKGLYTYLPATNHFVPAKQYQQVLGQQSIRYVKADYRGNLWFVSDKKVGVVEAGSRQIIYLSELQGKLASGFEHIFPYNNEYTIVGGDQGFFVVQLGKYTRHLSHQQVYIRSITGQLQADSVLYQGFGSLPSQFAVSNLSHHWKELMFEFAAPYSSQSKHLVYSYRLKGLSDAWSIWDAKHQKSFTKLPPGSYVFEVKCKNSLGVESAIAAYPFKILPPWYLTVWAKILWAIVLLLVVYVLVKIREQQLHKRHTKRMMEAQEQHAKAQQMQAFKHQLDIEKSNNDLMRLKNEKLESELAATAMNLVQKKEFLGKIREEVNKIRKEEANTANASILKKVVKDLTAEDRLNEDWEQFSIHFNSVHNNFLVSLKKTYPQLTAHDLKLCAYLRMNLSSKDMARLMNISIRGVEINRYRLRKKLALAPKENLFDFLLGVEQMKPTNPMDDTENKDA